MPARKSRKKQIKKEPSDGVAVIAENPAPSLVVTENNAGPSTVQRRSGRKRNAQQTWKMEDELGDEEFQQLLSAFLPNENNLPFPEASEPPPVLEQKKDETTNGEKSPKKPEDTGTPGKQADTKNSELDADVEVYDDEHNFGKQPFKISKARSASSNKRKKQSTDENHQSEDEEETIRIEDIQKYLKHIKTPRSTENIKYKKVYETIPKLRNASPPRFTTKGVPKKRLRPEELGVRIVGKTVGNPFSNFGKKRNGIIYGNQPLKTVEEMEKYAGAAINIKKVLRKQAEHLRLSSYVKPHVLEEARKLHVQKKTSKVNKEEDVDVDIETVDETEVNLNQKTKRKSMGATRGRKPGRSILECQDCGYKTTHSGHMKIHILCVHKDIKLLACQYDGCGYRCARKGSMTRHEKCVHRKDEVFKCEKCAFESAWSISLERHIVTKHEKLKPWTCEVCKRSFGQQFTLTTHMNTVHKKVKRIRCAFCNFRSATKVSVRAHILRMHKEEIEKAMNEAEENENAAPNEPLPEVEPIEVSAAQNEPLAEVVPLEVSAAQNEALAEVVPLEVSAAQNEPLAEVVPLEVSAAQNEPLAEVEPIEASAAQNGPLAEVEPIEVIAVQKKPSAEVQPIEASA